VTDVIDTRQMGRERAAVRHHAAYRHAAEADTVDSRARRPIRALSAFRLTDGGADKRARSSARCRTDSEPELVKKMRSIPFGAISASRSAKSNASG